MRTIFALILALTFTSCASNKERDIFETENGFSFRRSSSHIDSLRGASEKRDEEQMSFARNIIMKAGDPYVEYSGPPRSVPTTYTGVVKIYKWKGRDGKVKFNALREIQWANGSKSYQGPNPPTHFYGVRKMEEITITDIGPENIARLKEEGIL